MVAFVTDSFTDANGTSLLAHTGALGATWAKHASATNTGNSQIQTNTLVTTDNVANEIYYASGSPAAADYTVSLDFKYNGTTGTEIAGPAARLSTTVTDGYFFIYHSGLVQVRTYKYVAGTITQVGTGVAFTPTSGTTYRLTIDASGTTIAGRLQNLTNSNWLDSAGAFSATQSNCISTADSSISAAGKAGFWITGDSAGGTRGTADNFSADQAASGATATTLSGPSTGAAGAASTNFTVGANGSITGTVIITPADAAAVGTFVPTTVSINTASPTGTFTYTPASTGVKTISTTNNGSLANPASLSYTSTAYTQVNGVDPIGGQNVMVLVPASGSAVPYNSANPTNIILYVHGVGEDQTGLMTDALKVACRDALINAGYILAGTNAHGNNWGNQVSVDDYVALDRYIRNNYNVKSVALWSQSMGGLDGLEAVAQSRFPVCGWLGTYPICNLANLYSLSTFTAAINTAYGITGAGTATYANLTYGADPALKAAADYTDIPMRFYASASDTTVPKANNSDVLAAIVAGSRHEATVVVCTGNHGDPSHFQASDYLAFFARCFASATKTTRTVSLLLTSDGTTPRASLTGLKWAFYDEVAPDLALKPVSKGTGATTNASGIFTVSVSTTLAVSAVGWLTITDSDGTTTQSPAAKAFSGPVVVS